MSSKDFPHSFKLLKFLESFEPFYIFGLVVIGIIGNLISFAVFVLTKLKFGKNNIILSILALTDIGFLLTLILINFRHFSFDILNAYELICKISVFLNYLFGFLSAWLVVLFSIERFVAVYFPLSLNRICTATSQKVSLIIITTFGCILYSFNLFSTGLQKSYGGAECVPLDKWLFFAKYMTLVDIIATMALPFVLISIINVLIIFKLTESQLIKRRINNEEQRQKRLATITFIEMNSIVPNTSVLRISPKTSNTTLTLSKTPLYPQFNTNNIATETCTNAATDINKRSKSCVSSMTVSNMKTRKKHNTKTTKILLCISTAFLILNGPIATSKIFYLLKHDFFGTLTASSSTDATSNGIQKSHIERISSIMNTASSYDYYDEKDDKFLNISNLFNLSLSQHLPYLSNNYSIDKYQSQIQQVNLTFSGSNSKDESEKSDDKTNTMEKLAGLLTSNMYYLNFVLNFFLYSLNGSKFRRLYIGLFRRKLMRRTHLSTKPRRFKNVTKDI